MSSNVEIMSRERRRSINRTLGNSRAQKRTEEETPLQETQQTHSELEAKGTGGVREEGTPMLNAAKGLRMVKTEKHPLALAKWRSPWLSYQGPSRVERSLLSWAISGDCNKSPSDSGAWCRESLRGVHRLMGRIAGKSLSSQPPGLEDQDEGGVHKPGGRELRLTGS